MNDYYCDITVTFHWKRYCRFVAWLPHLSAYISKTLFCMNKLVFRDYYQCMMIHCSCIWFWKHIFAHFSFISSSDIGESMLICVKFVQEFCLIVTVQYVYQILPEKCPHPSFKPHPVLENSKQTCLAINALWGLHCWLVSDM